jgi:cytochrome c-type biogenesis protein CcmH/NrfF
MTKTMRSLTHSLTGLIVAALVLFASVAHAQKKYDEAAPDPEAVRMANEVSHEVMSPFCPGKTLAMCTSSAAADVRRDIQKMAASGMEKEKIKETVIEEYGEEFRMVEAGTSDNVPLLVGLGAGLTLAVIVVVVLSRRRSGEPDDATPAAASQSVEVPTDVDDDDPYLAQLRSEYRD